MLGQALCSPAQQPDPDADPDPDSRPRASNMQERLEQAEADEVEVGRPLEVLGLARNSLGEVLLNCTLAQVLSAVQPACSSAGGL